MEEKVVISTEKYEALVEQAMKAGIIENYALDHSDWDVGAFVRALFAIKDNKNEDAKS